MKFGSGAFMPSYEKAVELAESIIATAERAGLRTRAVMTDMNSVLGTTAGNALEIAEAAAYLRNERRDSRLDDVVMALCAEMLLVTGLEDDDGPALQRCDEAVTSGRAAEIFDAMCEALGGPRGFVADADRHLPRAPVTHAVHASGILAEVDVRAVGNTIIELGGGRRRVGESLDLSVGLSDIAPVGTALDREIPLAIVHAATEDDALRAERLLLDACVFVGEAPDVAPVVCEKISG